MITIDGSAGEGGGQILRTALSLALVTGQAFRIENIRANRPKPGLMRQHLTCVEAACEICDASADGVDLGSRTLSFRPAEVRPGSYQFAVGTAGSTSLVLQTILLPLALADAPSRLVLDGGTHNAGAPPFEFLARCFLPLLRKMGPDVTARLVRHGFYPRGGGRIEIEINPSPLRRIECVDRGALVSRQGVILHAGLPLNIADRELKILRTSLDWPEDVVVKRDLPSDQGPGNAILLEAEYEHTTEIVTGFAKLGMPAERLAKQAAKRIQGYENSVAFAGPYLADQLLLPFAVAGGGKFTTVKPSRHTRTNIETIREFVGRSFELRQLENGSHLIEM